MSRVAIVFTGGTIAMRPDSDAGGAVPALSGSEIVARTPGLSNVAAVDIIDWGLVPASHLSFDQLLAIGRVVEDALARPEVDGAVVVQGTDTIEETAFAYDLIVRSDKPVVVTGAMRNSSEADYDGPRNLTDAVRCAVNPALRGMGTLVVMNGLVIGADQAVKAHTTDFGAFRPRDSGPVAEVDQGDLRLLSRREGRPRLSVVPSSARDRVDLVTVTHGMDGEVLRLLRGLRPGGVVVAATGSGNTHPDILAAATELMTAGVVVCLTTRCPSGRVAPAYGFPGGGAQWQQAGAILSGLDGPKSRVALALGLAAGLSDGELRWILRA